MDSGLLRRLVGVPLALAVIGGYVAVVWAVSFLAVLLPFCFAGLSGGVWIQVSAIRGMLRTVIGRRLLFVARPRPSLLRRRTFEHRVCPSTSWA